MNIINQTQTLVPKDYDTYIINKAPISNLEPERFEPEEKRGLKVIEATDIDEPEQLLNMLNEVKTADEVINEQIPEDNSVKESVQQEETEQIDDTLEENNANI